MKITAYIEQDPKSGQNSGLRKSRIIKNSGDDMLGKNNTIIEEIKTRLVQTYHPLEIYILGVDARGVSHQNSDMDILVIIEQSDLKSYKRSAAGDLALWDVPVPRNLLILTKEEFQSRAKDISTLYYKIRHEGTKIYARA